MSYRPLSDSDILFIENECLEGHGLGEALCEQARRANRLADYLASALSEPSVRLEMLSFNMGVETINALAAYRGTEEACQHTLIVIDRCEHCRKYMGPQP